MKNTKTLIIKIISVTLLLILVYFISNPHIFNNNNIVSRKTNNVTVEAYTPLQNFDIQTWNKEAFLTSTGSFTIEIPYDTTVTLNNGIYTLSAKEYGTVTISSTIAVDGTNSLPYDGYINNIFRAKTTYLKNSNESIQIYTKNSVISFNFSSNVENFVKEFLTTFIYTEDSTTNPIETILFKHNFESNNTYTIFYPSNYFLDQKYTTGYSQSCPNESLVKLINSNMQNIITIDFNPCATTQYVVTDSVIKYNSIDIFKVSNNEYCAMSMSSPQMSYISLIPARNLNFGFNYTEFFGITPIKLCLSSQNPSQYIHDLEYIGTNMDIY